MEAVWNSLCRQRRMVKLLVLVVAVTVWHRSHARSGNPVFSLPKALARLMVPKLRSNESNVCLESQQYRGGYREETDTAATSSTITIEAPVIRKHKKNSFQQHQQQDNPALPFRFSLFQTGDGHETDVDGIPQRYLNMHNGNRDLSKQSLEQTLAWRAEHSIDTLLQEPHANYDVAKAVFPHYFAGRDEHNHVVFVQRPGLLSMELATANGLTKEALLRHYIFVNEYLWQIVERDNPMATMLGIIDLQGINLKVLRQGDILAFLKLFVKTMDAHYPQRAHKTLLINTPKWFNVVYKLVSPLLRETTKDKIEILSRGKKQDHVLKNRLGEHVATQVLPESFFSNYNNKKKKKNQQQQRRKQQHHDEEEEESDDDSTAASDETSMPVQSQLETDLREFVLERLSEAGVEMTAPVLTP